MRTALAILFTLAATAAIAEPYAFVGVGRGTVEVESTPEPDAGFAFQLGAGYRLNRYFSAEASLGMLKTQKSELATSDSSRTAESESTLATIAILGHIPVSERFSIIGKLGASHVDHELEERTATQLAGGGVRQTATSTSSKEWLPTYGIGLALHSSDVEWRLLLEHTEGKSGTELGSLQSIGVQAVVLF